VHLARGNTCFIRKYSRPL